MKNLIVAVLLVALALVIPCEAFAQCGPGGCAGGRVASRVTAFQPIRRSVGFFQTRRPVRRALSWVFCR